MRQAVAAAPRQGGHEADSRGRPHRVEARDAQAARRRHAGDVQRPRALPLRARQEGRRREGAGPLQGVVRHRADREDRQASRSGRSGPAARVASAADRERTARRWWLRLRLGRFALIGEGRSGPSPMRLATARGTLGGTTDRRRSG